MGRSPEIGIIDSLLRKKFKSPIDTNNSANLTEQEYR